MDGRVAEQAPGNAAYVARKIVATIERRKREDVNDVLQGLRKGHTQGRVVLDIGRP